MKPYRRFKLWTAETRFRNAFSALGFGVAKEINTMGEASLSRGFRDLLRRFPKAYQSVRRIHSTLVRLVTETLRVCTKSFIRLGPPAATVCLADRIRRNEVEGRFVLEAQPIPEPGPASVTTRVGWDIKKFYPWPIIWARVPSARLVGPGLALMLSNKRLAIESVWNEHCYQDDPSYNYFSLPRPARLAGNWTSLIGRYRGSYFHWIMDDLPRLGCLDEFPPDTRILIPPKPRPFEYDSLRLLGLVGRTRETDERHLEIEDYYFSGPTAMTGLSNPYAVKFLRNNLLLRGIPPKSPQPYLFITRKGKTRGLANETEVDRFFEQRNWTVVDPGYLSFAEQIGLFRQARAICACHGAGLTNVLWCDPGTKVFEILAHNFLNGCYENIAQLCGVKHRYLVLQGDTSFRVTVPTNLIEKQLDWLCQAD
jgi:capsular polysaccharide biosynthesis protein